MRTVRNICKLRTVKISSNKRILRERERENAYRPDDLPSRPTHISGISHVLCSFGVRPSTQMSEKILPRLD
jgi:hypothetical protein